MPNENSRDDMAVVLREMSDAQGGEIVETQAREVTPVERATDLAPTAPAAEGRDASGRFAPRTPAQEQVPADKKPAAEVAVKPAVAAPKPGPLTAPVSWKPDERESWATVPERAQVAIHRREREMDQALRTTAEARQVYSELSRIVTPHMAMIKAENSTPLRSIEYLFKTAADLRTLSPGPKAAMIADLIRQFNVDVQMLDAILRQGFVAGGAPAAAPMTPIDMLLQAIDQRLKPVQDFMSGVQTSTAQNEEQIVGEIQQTWEQFANDPANEFANDLADDIADLLTLAANRNQHLPLQDAYKRAILAHPTISQIVADRSKTAGASQQTAAARRALEAAASITDSGGALARGGEDESDGSTRSDIVSAIKTLSARR